MRRDEIRYVSLAIVSPRLDDPAPDQIQLAVVPSSHADEYREVAAAWRQEQQRDTDDATTASDDKE